MLDEICDDLDNRVITPLTVARYRSCPYYLTAQNLQQTSSYEVINSKRDVSTQIQNILKIKSHPQELHFRIFEFSYFCISVFPYFRNFMNSPCPLEPEALIFLIGWLQKAK